MNNVFLILGGNLGERKKNLAKAAELLGKAAGRIKRCSPIYETEPWGVEGQPNYYNQVVEMLTDLDAHSLINTILEIEKQMGRIRTEKYDARTIDIDILFFNDDIINTGDLTVPHPRIQERRFVLEPLAEIAPEFIHPVLNRSVAALLKETSDDGKVSLTD